MNIIFIDDDGKVDYEQHGKILNQLYGKIKECKRKDKEIERLNNIIKQIKKCIDYYAIENEDFSKLYNNEEIEILKIIGSDKE